jgi:signal transduction histidine kinase
LLAPQSNWNRSISQFLSHPFCTSKLPETAKNRFSSLLRRFFGNFWHSLFLSFSKYPLYPLSVTTTPPDLVAVADLGLLTTVLRNLVGNALKFTPKNGQVHLLAHATPDGQVEFAVTDSGPGIAPDHLTELLTADQLPSTPGTNGEPGTGLGLPLSARFVRLMGGELLITSAPGEGTRAAFRLPGRVGAAQRGA